MRGYPAHLGESGCKSPAVPVTVIPLGSGCSRRRSDDVPEPLRLSRIASHLARCRVVCRRCAWGSGGKGTPMGELERNMRDDVGQPQGNAPSTDNGGQMDMFEDERERASLHRRGAIARGVVKRGLVAFLAFAMAFGTTPAQLWAEGAEGIAEAVAQAATPGEDAALAGGAAEQSGAEVSDSGSASATSAATTEAATGDQGSATGESPATSEQSSMASAGQAGSAAATAAQTENPTETGDVAKKQVEVSFSIIGTDADGKAQTWVTPTQLKLDEGATAADAFIKLQEKTGFKAKYEPNTA